MPDAAQPNAPLFSEHSTGTLMSKPQKKKKYKSRYNLGHFIILRYIQNTFPVPQYEFSNLHSYGMTPV